MLGSGWFYDENGSLMHKDDVGISQESMGRRATGLPITRPATSLRQPLRKIGNPSPGVWNDVKVWWTGLKPEHKLGVGALGSLALIGIVVAATRKGGAEAGLKKV